MKSCQVKGAIEDHGLWVRIRVKEKRYEKPGDKSTETVEESFILYSVGKLWYLHGGRIDYVLFEVPEEEETEAEKSSRFR